MSRFLYTAILAIFCTINGIMAQTPELKVYADNTDAEFIILAHYGGPQIMPDDTLYRNAQGAYYLPRNAAKEGFYILANFETSKFIDVILSSRDKSVTIRGDFAELETISFQGSPENKAFRDFMLNLSENNMKIRQANKEDDLDTVEKLKEANQNDLRKLKKDFPKSVLATFAQAQTKMDIPEFQGSEEDVRRATYYYRLDHFFDGVKDDPRYWSSRFFKEMPEKYVFQLTVNRPDSIAKSMGRVLDLIEPAEDAFAYYLSEWVRKYQEDNQMNNERIWVYLTQNYIANGRADAFIPVEAKATLIDKANKQANCLIGQKALDLKMPTLDVDRTLALPEGSKQYYVLSDPQSLYDQENSVTILFFWKADCEHCQEAYPELLQLMKKYEDQGIGCYAVNSGSYKKYKEAAAFIKKHGGDKLIYNMVDPTYESKYAEKYYFPSTPGIFILDEDKNIVFNRMAGSQLANFTEKALQKLGFLAK